MKHDVVVVGGGIAGSLAAVAAARKGCSVIVIEETGQLGGSLTSSGTGPMMTFHAGEKQVIRGLGEELISRLREKGLSP
ncbi:MAG: FAD-dependent oxidoreductase, partial [Bullifex sp.]|nr:FAD-dependent oxidoreductase [Bullifex sp.]